MAIGRPGAYRFVGTTLGKNPYPILIPCHRIIRSDKGMGGFGGGIDLKKRLIDFESHYR
jgi:O-6-methylguanine DNA methyltransferase